MRFIEPRIRRKPMK